MFYIYAVFGMLLRIMIMMFDMKKIAEIPRHSASFGLKAVTRQTMFRRFDRVFGVNCLLA
jgi:hypothetical protein